MFNLMANGLACLALAVLLQGCQSPAPVSEAGRAAVLRQHNPRARVVEIPVPKRDFVSAARNIEQIRRLRLVEVTATEEGGRSPFPEYRLFNIAPQSAYALLGLTEGDVLVSANDYALNDPELFKQYVQVLHVESGETFIEIRRNGEPLILSYRFVG